MKKTHKRVLGLLGILVVTAITALAAFLPVPATQATTTTVVDQINVRVVGTEVEATITEPESGSQFVNPNQTIAYQYANVKYITLTLVHTDASGTTTEYVLIDAEDVDYATDAGTMDLNLDVYGYGEYKLYFHGEGVEGLTADDEKVFSYYPVMITAKQDTSDTDYMDVALSYDATNTNIANILVQAYDANGNLVGTTTVARGATTAQFDFSEEDSGTYTFTATALDASGNALYLPATTTADFKVDAIPVPHTADTGGLFKNANISQVDYLITGMVIFGIIAVAGTVFILKSDKKKR